MKTSEKVLEQLTDGVSHFVSGEACAPKTIAAMQALNSAYKYLSLSSMVEIMSYDIFLQKKMLHGESIVEQQTGPKDKAPDDVSSENSKLSRSLSDVKNMLSAACDGFLLGKLTKLLASCEFDNETYHRAKVVFVQFIFISNIFMCFQQNICNSIIHQVLVSVFLSFYLFFYILEFVFHITFSPNFAFGRAYVS